MIDFSAIQSSPKMVRYSAVKWGKDRAGRDIIIATTKGEVGTEKVKDFDLSRMTRFARTCAVVDLG